MKWPVKLRAVAFVELCPAAPTATASATKIPNIEVFTGTLLLRRDSRSLSTDSPGELEKFKSLFGCDNNRSMPVVNSHIMKFPHPFEKLKNTLINRVCRRKFPTT
jgi:hypothetical protein